VHELSLVSAAIAQAVEVAQGAGASHIQRLTFALPVDDHITEESVRTLVEALGKNTPVDGAAVAFESQPGDRFALTSVDVLVDD
jgi:Zn finger protein HypA/HybF involved in hydrogenase expression